MPRTASFNHFVAVPQAYLRYATGEIMIKRDILCEHDYLHIPIIPGGERNDMQIWAGGQLVRSFCLALTDEGGEYFFLNVSQHRNKVLTLLVADPEGITEAALNRVVSGDEAFPGHPLYQDMYQEPLRPLFHFSSRRGWLNDPNGLFYKDGLYHMYYQHNPLGTPHGGVNICWGHAISRDLLHWEEKDDAILPWRRDWSVASGSAVIDFENRAGYGKDAIIAAFTALGSPNIKKGYGYPSGGQFLAASTDGGDTFYLFSHEATVSALNGYGWRDPRLFRYEDHYVMAVYETNANNKNCVSFYVSENFHDWRLASRNDDLYECPDIFPLKVEGTDEIRWILYGADGMARIGDFDGYHFTESGQSNPLDYGNVSYAGQTWSHHPEGKRIHISWVRGMGGTGEDLGYEEMPFSQCMSIPCEITLKKSEHGIYVSRAPISEVQLLRQELLFERAFEQTAETAIEITSPAQYVFDLSSCKDTLSLRIGPHTIQYRAEERKLLFENGHSVPLSDDALHFTALIDTTTVELCFDDRITASYAMAPEFMSLIIKGSCFVSCQCYRMENIWADMIKASREK